METHNPLRLIFGAILLAAHLPAASAQTTNLTASASPPVFQLGTVYIIGETNQVEPASVLAERLTPQEIQRYEAKDLADALNTLPGITHNNVGPRNESGVYVRGFDLRQVPLFIDGIPVYVPYDGYVDLRRFTTFDTAEISVSKGFSSVIYGPNALGGAINVVSRRPQKEFEMDALAGGFSGEGKEFSLNIGGKKDRWYYQAGGSLLDQDHFRLSDDFKAVPGREDGGIRENSYRKDWKGSFKVGYTPNETDEYAIGYLYQGGEKGNPVYTGTLSPARFWQWPEWNKQSVYYVSRTQIGSSSYVKPRIYFDKFDNTLKSFNNATYTTQTLPFTFTSIYDDYTWGSSLEVGTELIPHNLLKAAIHYKYDYHNEHNVGAPYFTFKDQTVAFALEDTVELTEKFSLVAGISYEFRDVLEAVDTNSGAALGGDTFDSLNPEAALLYDLPRIGKVHLSVARKSRFPTIKDRYSYRLGTAIPNPNLQPETAMHYEVGYTGDVVENLTFRANLFFSKLEDTIQRVDNVLPGRFQLQNVGRSEHLGTELGLDWRARPEFQTGFSYTFLQRENQSRPDIYLIDTPEHKIFGYAEASPLPWLTFTPSVEYNTGRFGTSTGVKLNGFLLANLKVTARVAEGFYFNFGVNNLTDKNYMLAEGFPEAGRNYFLNLRYNF